MQSVNLLLSSTVTLGLLLFLKLAPPVRVCLHVINESGQLLQGPGGDVMFQAFRVLLSCSLLNAEETEKVDQQCVSLPDRLGHGRASRSQGYSTVLLMNY